MRWLINNLYQLDCLVGCLLTGVRNKTISSWLGGCRANRYGRFWAILTYPLYWLVDETAAEVFGQPGHCEDAAIPFQATLNPD